MNKIQDILIKISKKAAGRHLRRAVGALLCVLLTGCNTTDKALAIELGEPVEIQESADESFPDTDRLDAASARVGLSESGDESGKEDVAVLYVYVCGAVLEPGVVMLPEGSRCKDALEAAGGFAEEASRDAVNLAAHVSDGEQIYFPTVQEAEAAASSGRDGGLVNINSAGEELLCTLPGIGEAKARAIVTYREQNGGFEAAEDIMQVPGIKESAYSQIKDLITIK